MRRDEEDSSSLEHKQTRKVPDQTTAELMRELESEATNPRIRMPVRRGATYTALVPPPGQVIPGTSQEQPGDEEATEAFAAVSDVPDVPDVPARRREWVRWAVIVGSLLGIVLLGLGAWSSFVKMQEKEAAATAKATLAAAPPAPAHASSKKAAEKQSLPEAKQADAAPLPSKEVPPAAEPVPPAAEPAAAADRGTEAAAEDHADEAAGTDSGDAAQEIDEAMLAKAIKGRKIRQLDQLLVSHASRKKSSFAKAEAHCEALEVAGISGWRLPEIGELVSIGGARLVRRYIFWSKTVGDASGERRLTWNAKRRRIGPMSPTWRGGKAVCVRTRP